MRPFRRCSSRAGPRPDLGRIAPGGAGNQGAVSGDSQPGCERGCRSRVSAWPLPRRRHLAWMRRALSAAGTDSACRAHRLSKGQGLALGSRRAGGWTQQARALGGGAGRWEACRLAISSSQGCDSLGPTNGPETQCPKRATGRGLPGGAGGRGPMMPPPLQSMNYPHSQPAPNPGPTMQPERAGREALASPTQAALQAGGPLVAAAPPRPQFPAL